MDLPNQVPEVSVPSVGEDGALRERQCDVCVCVKYVPVFVNDALDGRKLLFEGGGEGCAFAGAFGFVKE